MPVRQYRHRLLYHVYRKCMNYILTFMCFRYNGRVTGTAYAPGSGPIWLDDVRCVGNEVSIANCRHRGWGTHNCDHIYDVSVSCGSSPGQYGWCGCYHLTHCGAL